MTARLQPIPPEREGDPWTLPAIRYERVEATSGIRPSWRIPEHERARCESPQSSWARRGQRPADASPERSPFQCAGCDAPLTAWARERGFVYCNAACREGSTRRK